MASNILLVLLGFVLALRLFIWQFFPNTEVFFKEEFSDIAVAFLILILAVVWFFPKLLKQQSLKKSGLEFPVILLFTAAAASVFLAPDFPSSLRGVLVLGAQITFFYMLLDLLDSPSRLRWALIFILSLTLVVSVFGIVTFFDLLIRPHSFKDISLQETNIGLYYLLHHPRAVSFFSWPNILAGYLLLFLPLGIIIPFYFNKIWQKFTALAGLFIVAVCFLYTLSFLAWLSFLLSTLVFFMFFGDKIGIEKLAKEKKRMLLYCFICFFIFFLLVILRKNFLMSLSPRLFYYKAAFTLISKNYIWGYGWNSFGILCRTLAGKTGDLSAYIHNSYLQIYLETGVLGFLGIVLLVIGVFSQVRTYVSKNLQQKREMDLYRDWMGINYFFNR